jgi:Protein of unknown function (DUF2924)
MIMARRSTAPGGTAKASLEDEIIYLGALDLKGLRTRWQTVTARQLPSHLPRHLIIAMLAYRLQAEALGDLDAETVRLLRKVGVGGRANDVVTLTSASDLRRREVLLGTLLTREWNGQSHRVTVVNDGFTWEGRTYDSLSKVAFAITGTKWNGPRFFGLRDTPLAQVKR